MSQSVPRVAIGAMDTEEGTHEGQNVEREARHAVDEEAEVVKVDGSIQGIPEEVAWGDEAQDLEDLGRRSAHPHATATVVPTRSSHPHSLSASSVSEPKQLNASGRTMKTWNSDTTWIFLGRAW